MKGDLTQNELALIEAAREGGREAIQTLLRRHWPWLKGLVYGILGSTRDLDDVMQDICLRVITRIRTLREPSSFRAWVATVARREALNYRHRRPMPSAWSDGSATLSPPDRHVYDPAEDVEKKELYARMAEAIRGLPEKYREVLVLAHSGELTYAQMAEVLNVPITTMQIRLVRARRMIRDRIAGTSEQRIYER